MPMMRCTGCGEALVPDDAVFHCCPEREEPGCSKCGITESESAWGTLIAIRVTTHEGEEGSADVTQLLCDECVVPVLDALHELGFIDHRHGGANFLEDEECRGYKSMHNCPTPTQWGPVTVPSGGWAKTKG